MISNSWRLSLQKKFELASASVVSIFELDSIPEIKNEPEEINPCML